MTFMTIMTLFYKTILNFLKKKKIKKK